MLLGRHEFFLSESRNPKPSSGIRSRLTSMSLLVVPRRLSRSKCPLPSLVTGRGQVLWPSKHPTSLQILPLLDSLRSLRRIRFLLSRRARRSWPCVRIFTNAMMPRLIPLLREQMVREWKFSISLFGLNLYLANNGAGSSCPREGLRGYVVRCPH